VLPLPVCDLFLCFLNFSYSDLLSRKRIRLTNVNHVGMDLLVVFKQLLVSAVDALRDFDTVGQFVFETGGNLRTEMGQKLKLTMFFQPQIPR